MNLRDKWNIGGAVLVAAMLAVCPFVGAAEFVGQNAEGSIGLTISNDGESVSPANGLRIFAKIVPESMSAAVIVDQANSILGPVCAVHVRSEHFDLKFC